MRLATVELPEGTTTAAAHVDGQWRRLDAPDLGAALAIGLEHLAAGAVLTDVALVQPLPRPGKIICCGLNYRDHIRETGRELPAYPTLFAKYGDTLIGPGADIHAPRGADLDWEAELAVVVGSEVRNASRETAIRSIAGYTIANDISVRDWQYRTPQWFQGKAWDATTPLGPVVVTPDEFDPESAEVSCAVNGVERQRGSAGSLVFDSADLIAYITTFTVLRPGDLVLTGTPGGVGMAMTPATYLQDGDVVETTITGIGTLTNRVSLN